MIEHLCLEIWVIKMSNIYDEDDDLIDDEAVETLVIDIMEKKNEIKRKTPMLAEI